MKVSNQHSPRIPLPEDPDADEILQTLQPIQRRETLPYPWMTTADLSYFVINHSPTVGRNPSFHFQDSELARRGRGWLIGPGPTKRGRQRTEQNQNIFANGPVADILYIEPYNFFEIKDVTPAADLPKP